MFYLFTIIHELGHILMAYILRVNINEIILLPIGVNAKYIQILPIYKDLLISVAGPTVSIILAIISSNVLYSNINILIATLNLIPIYPLDGGRIIKSIVVFFVGYKNGIIICGNITKIFAILLGLVSVIFAVYFRNYSLILVVLYVFVLIKDEIKKDRIRSLVYEMIG